MGIRIHPRFNQLTLIGMGMEEHVKSGAIGAIVGYVIAFVYTLSTGAFDPSNTFIAGIDPIVAWHSTAMPLTFICLGAAIGFLYSAYNKGPQ